MSYVALINILFILESTLIISCSIGSSHGVSTKVPVYEDIFHPALTSIGIE